MKKALLLILVLLLPALVFAGTTGKIAGIVVDAETGDALPGANVIVEGTMMGSSTDINGQFVILNVPPGIYAVKSSFIGYQTVVNKNIRVSVDLTTGLNFSMAPESIEGEEVVITATRPLVERNTTNETAIMTSDQIENMPLRTLAGAVATNTGVVTARGDMYVRGGRTNEVAYYVDGVYSNDLRTGQQVGSLPITSLEQVNYQAGGFSAEYGFANSGIVIASTKGGSKEMNISAEIITDEFLSPEEKFLGTYSYGYNVYNMTVSGPIVGDKLSYFVNGEYTYQADRLPTSSTHPELDGDFTAEEITLLTGDMDDLGIPAEERILPLRNVEGPLPNNSLNRWSANGNVLWTPSNALRVKVGGNGSVSGYQSYSQSYSLVNGDNVRQNDRYNYNVFAKVTHMLGKNTYYDFTGYYSNFGFEYYNQDFERNLANYRDKTDWNGDGIFNESLVDDGVAKSSYPRLGNGMFTPPQYPYGYYNLDRSSVMGAKLDLTSQIDKIHEVKFGFEYRYNTIRRYNTQAFRLSGTFANNPDIDPASAYRAAYTENFGFPLYFDGHEVDPANTVDDGQDGAKHPLIGALYIQDKIELSDLVLNVGLRADYMNANDKRLKDPYDVVINNDTIDPTSLEDTEAHLTISPRLGLSFPVTDRTVFHAQYGKFVQQPELQYLYTGWSYYAGQMLAGNQVDVGNPDLGPVQTISYEVGIGQQLSTNSSVSVTAYYKEITDNIVLKNRTGAAPSTYAQYQNGDYGNVKGMSFTYKLRPTNGLAVNANYTLQYASGTGSTSDGNFYVTWIGNDYYPVFVSPLDYDQRHTLSLNVDYRRPTWGVNALASAGSGFPFTPKKVADTVFGAGYAAAYPMGAINSSYTDWTYNLDIRVDKSFEVGPVNMNVYLWVMNVLGSVQPFNRKYDNGNSYGSGIYESTGRPDDNGFLSTAEGQKWVEANGGERAEAMYRSYINFPANWNSPRQIRLGLRFDL